MPGRIRTVKPEILEDSKTAKLSHEAWRLFVSGLLLADDYGTLRAEPGQLLGAAFWATDANVRAATDELVASGLWVIYKVKGQQYAQVKNWSKHQKVNHPGKVRLPGTSEADSEQETRKRLSGDSQEALLPLSPLTTTSTTTTTGRSRKRSALSLGVHEPEAGRLWELQNQLRRDVSPRARTLLPSPDRLARIAARLDAGATSADCEHVLRVYAAEAKANGEIRWLNGETNWRSENFDRALGMSLSGERAADDDAALAIIERMETQRWSERA